MAELNSLSGALNPEIWSTYMQDVLTKSLVSFQIADTSLQPQLKVGDTIHVPYFTELTATDYTLGSSISFTGVTATDDYITVTSKKVAPFYIDDIEELQAKPEFIGKLSENAAYKLRDTIDQTVLGKVTAAAVKFGLSGSSYATASSSASLTALTVNSATVVPIFSNIAKVLREKNVENAGDWVAIITPTIYQAIEEHVANSGHNLGDKVLENGYGGRFMGFDLYISNNLPSNHFYAGRKGQISLILQQDVKMDIKDVPDKLGKNFIPWTVYGAGVLTQSAKRFLDCII